MSLFIKVNSKLVVYMDPADGRMHQKTHEEFQKEWTGILVLMEPEETFQKGDMKKSVTAKFFFIIGST